jgi:hypothetical protein
MRGFLRAKLTGAGRILRQYRAAHCPIFLSEGATRGVRRTEDVDVLVAE